MKSIAVIIPAYNEEKSIEEVVRKITEISVSINCYIESVVVNDCSTDNTELVCKSLDCVLLNLPANLGIGGAVQTGFIYAYNNGFDYAVQVDGDGQHPADQLTKFVEKFKISDTDVIIGSRYIEKSGFQSSLQRRIGIRFLNFWIKILTSISITDCTSGFRMLNRKALEVVKDFYPDDYPEPESIIIFHKNKLKIAEIPVVMKNREKGKSSIHFLSSIFYMIKVSLAIFFTYIKK